MRYIDILEDCSNCPILLDGLCHDGFATSYTGGCVEPPCTMFENETDVNEWLENYHKSIKIYEEQEVRRLKDERSKKQKQEIANKKRRYLDRYCSNENNRVRDARARLRLHKNMLDYAYAATESVNLVNKMFGYSNSMKVNTSAEQYTLVLERELEDAKKDLRKKQDECRKTKEYMSIS